MMLAFVVAAATAAVAALRPLQAPPHFPFDELERHQLTAFDRFLLHAPLLCKFQIEACRVASEGAVKATALVCVCTSGAAVQFHILSLNHADVMTVYMQDGQDIMLMAPVVLSTSADAWLVS